MLLTRSPFHLYQAPGKNLVEILFPLYYLQQNVPGGFQNHLRIHFHLADKVQEDKVGLKWILWSLWIH